MHYLTIATATVALTFPALTAGSSFSFWLKQDATGGRLVTFPATVKWPNGQAATLSTAAAAVDVFTAACVDGTTWDVFPAGLNMS
jgi:hypothetical protein